MNFPIPNSGKVVMSLAESIGLENIRKYLLSLSAGYFYDRSIIIDSDFDKELAILSFSEVKAAEFHNQNNKVEIQNVRFSEVELKKMIEFLDRDGFVYIKSGCNGREVRLRVEYHPENDENCTVAVDTVARQVNSTF